MAELKKKINSPLGKNSCLKCSGEVDLEEIINTLNYNS